MKRKIYFVSLILFFPLIMYAQSLDEVVSKLYTFNSQFPQEKIYVHFDKQHYYAGQDIWFKAYLTNAQYLGSDPVSNVLRVELIDPNNQVIDERLLRVVNGGAVGDFKLSDSLISGTYTIRTYTNWMRNFDNAFFYSKDFRVVNNRKIHNSLKNSNLELSLEFFPEGGELVEGVPSIVAFKAINSNGRGVDIDGIVVNSNGEKLSDFKSIKSGIGVFLINPRNEELFAEVVWNGSKKRFSLPNVELSGYSMRVNNIFKSDNITIAVSSRNYDLQNGFIVGHQAGKVFALSANTSKENSFALSIARSAFPPGICHLTFFDQKGMPRAERLVFANYPKMIDLEVQPLELHGKRSAARIDLSLKGDSIGANLSVSITPYEESGYVDNSENIRNYLYLGSDLKGYVEDPDYYFSKNKDSFKAMDYLLLTHGWRRFRWQEVLNSDKRASFWVEKGITFSGTIFDYYNRDKSRVGKISMSVLSQDFNFVEGETNEDGRFFINHANFFEPTDLLFQAKRRKRNKPDKYLSDVYIKLDKWNAPPVSSFNRQVFISDTVISTLNSLNEKIEQIDRAYNFDPDAIILDDVEVVAKRRDIIKERLTSANVLYENASNRIVADSTIGIEGFGSAFDLIGRIPGVRIGGVFPNQSALIRGATSINASLEPLYLLNGVPVDGATITTIPAQDVSFIDVLKGPDAVIYGSRASGGVVAIYTRIGDNTSNKVVQGFLNVKHPGYSQAREFYIPDYSIPKEEHVKPDFRSTLYWNPNVNVDDSGQTQLEFYTSDQLGTFSIIIEGIAQDGTPIFKRDTLNIDN